MHQPYVRKASRLHARTGGGWSMTQIAKAYQFPTGLKVAGPTPVIAIIELGGGYSLPAIQSWLAALGLPPATVTDHSVLGAGNHYTGDPGSADVEVVLDVAIAAAAYSHCTGQPATIVVVFAPNSNAGFTAAVAAARALGATTGSISWGSPEDQWGTAAIQAMDQAFADGAAAGLSWFAAAGDNGSGDGEAGNHADYPGSSSYVTSCGGTRLAIAADGAISETVWNAGGGATGGGFSAVEAVPAWQRGFVPAGQLRGVPDLCADADPATGYQVPTFGVVGGTSCVAPLMAGLFAAFAATMGRKLGCVNPAIYAAEPAFNDIVDGNNVGFSATKGWDPASGLGSPIGTKLLASLSGQAGQPAPVPAPPPIAVPVPSGPTEAQVLATVRQVLAGVRLRVGWSVVRLPAEVDQQVEAAVHHLYAAPHALELDVRFSD